MSFLTPTFCLYPGLGPPLAYSALHTQWLLQEKLLRRCYKEQQLISSKIQDLKHLSVSPLFLTKTKALCLILEKSLQLSRTSAEQASNTSALCKIGEEMTREENFDLYNGRENKANVFNPLKEIRYQTLFTDTSRQKA